MIAREAPARLALLQLQPLPLLACLRVCEDMGWSGYRSAAAATSVRTSAGKADARLALLPLQQLPLMACLRVCED